MPEVLLHFDVNGGSLCATFYSIGYVRGKHDSKTQK